MKNKRDYIILYICLIVIAIVIIRLSFFNTPITNIDDKIEVKSTKNITLEIDATESALYDYYVELEREKSTDYAIYVLSPYDNEYLEDFVNKLVSNVTNDIDTINTIASFVQEITYEEEIDYEYPKYPIETLVDTQGDCEDKSILCASFLDLLGYNVSLFSLPNHMAVGVNLNESVPDSEYYVDKYYYLEVTEQNTSLGYIPTKYSYGRDVTVYPITYRVAIFHTWNSVIYTSIENSNNYFEMNMSLKNLGKTTIEQILFKVTCIGEEDTDISIAIDSLESLQEKIIEVVLNIPFEESVTITTQINVKDTFIEEKTVELNLG